VRRVGRGSGGRDDDNVEGRGMPPNSSLHGSTTVGEGDVTWVEVGVGEATRNGAIGAVGAPASTPAAGGGGGGGGGRAVTGTSPPEKGATPVEVGDLGDLARARAGKVAKGLD
jgi:hypothetical protein